MVMGKQQKRERGGNSTKTTNALILLPNTNKNETRGRKPAITSTTLERLREAYLMGCDDDEACSYAEISTMTLYRHQKVNPSFKEWKSALKQRPFLVARKTIVEHLSQDPEFALKYMERKKKAEFSPAAKLTIDDQRKLEDEDKDTVGNALMEHILRSQKKKADNAKQSISSTDR